MEQVNILLVEDEFIIAEDTRESLIGLGYNVQGIAASFNDAVEMINESLPDIAILDIQLKGEKTGIDLGFFIRQHFNFPFIYLSSYADKKTVNDAKASEPDAYLVKPFSEKELYTSIEIAINNFSKKLTNKEKAEENDIAIIKDAIFIKKDCYFKKVKLADVVFIRSDGNYLEIVANDRVKHLIRSTFNDFFNGLSTDKFYRIHKSYAINLEYVTAFSNATVFLQEYELPISKSRKEEFMKNISLFS
jgi:two-component system, LytTR family, response regulator LytT